MNFISAKRNAGPRITGTNACSSPTHFNHRVTVYSCRPLMPLLLSPEGRAEKTEALPMLEHEASESFHFSPSLPIAIVF